MTTQELELLQALVHARVEANHRAIDEALADIPVEIQERVRELRVENRTLSDLFLEIGRQLLEQQSDDEVAAELGILLEEGA